MSSGFWFLLVGASAATLHMVMFTLALFLFPNLWPEVANLVGFLIAFFVSFFGHRYLSFQYTDLGLTQSFLRFMFTSLAGFITNEIFFMIFLRWASLPLIVAAIGGQIVAALQTFLLSRFWAFKHQA